MAEPREDGVGPIRYSGVFFDFDGVLAESADIKTDAFADLYAPHGPEIVQKALDYHLQHAGISRLVKILHIHKEYLGIELDADEHHRLGEQYADLVMRKVVAAPWVPGARETLEKLHGRIPLFVVSGTPEGELRHYAQERHMENYFTEVRGSPPFKPEIIDELLATHGVEREGAIMIGDATTDHDAARATGIAFLGRVPEGRESPFPEGTPTAPDLIEFARSL